MKKVSIILPVYNKVKYIKKSINSILSQTFNDFELIIIDDGSIDGTGIICDKYAQTDSRIRVYHIKNGGVSNARNHGIEKSEGKYLQFMDADDYLDFKYLEEMVEIIESNDVGLVLSGFRKVNHEGDNLIEVLPMLNGNKNKGEFLSNFGYEQSKTGIYGYAWNKLVKSEIIKNNGIKFNTNVKLAEDYLFWINVYKFVDKIYFSSKAYYNYLQDAENSSMGKNIYVDYYIQIMIALEAKQLLRQSKLNFKESKKWVEYRISNFVFCFVFHQRLDQYKSFKSQLDRVLYRNDIMESISLFDQSFLNKIVLSLIKIKCCLGLFIFLKSRDILRIKYRKFKGMTEI